LCRAQKWLRDSTAIELEMARLYEDRLSMSGNQDAAAMRAMTFFRNHPQIKPFRDPFFWAGFMLYGIDGSEKSETN
jgi:CHAT domain-containing protein